MVVWRFALVQVRKRDAPIHAALSAAGCGSLVVLGLIIFAGLAPAAGVAGVIIMVASASLIGWWIAAQDDPASHGLIAPTGVTHEGSPPYASLLDALPDPLLVISAAYAEDPVGPKFILTNAAARDLLRIQGNEGLLVTAIRDPMVLEAVDEALFGAVVSEAIYEIGGTQARVLRAIAKPLLGRVPGAHLAMLVLRDETDIRSAERTRADFLANASHELRTPLASLSGFIETLRGHARTDEAAREKFLAIMQSQAERMSRLIDDLLSLSRIELNEHIAPDDEVDIAVVVKEVMDGLAPLARERSVQFEAVLCPAGQALCLGDRDQLVQVVQNLADNALKYAPRGSNISVSLTTGLTAQSAASAKDPSAARLSLLTPDHSQAHYAAFQVTDSGLGLARENLPRLTERFYRVEGQKSGEKSGTGLGLAIVKHIVNRHRGGMMVESIEGHGTTFTVYFPLSPANQRALSGDSGDVTKLS